VSGNLKLAFFLYLKGKQYTSTTTIMQTVIAVIVNAMASATRLVEDFPVPTTQQHHNTPLS
jgi:hypothetical protein